MSRILIADDEEGIRTTLGIVLEAYGYEIILAANGDDAERLFKENHPDLVIIDIFMPGKNGLETLRNLKSDFPGMKSIVISGGGVEAIKGDKFDFMLQVADGIGANMVMEKTFQPEELVSAVRAMLEGLKPS